MYYEFRVSLNGNFLFATDPSSCITAERTDIVAQKLMEKFPEKEGFSISIHYHPDVSYGISCLESYLKLKPGVPDLLKSLSTH